MKYDDLEKISHLRESGVLTEEEFQREKEKILSSAENVSSAFSWNAQSTPLLGMQENHYCAVMHFSLLLGCTALPMIGLVIPIVIWAFGKETSEQVDIQGRLIFDWLLSSLIYIAVAGCLIFFGIGFVLIFVLAICWVVFPIVAGIKAIEGKAWKYPCSISFFSAKAVISSAKNPEQSVNTDKSSKTDKGSHFSARKYQ
ncbi:MAG: DUF4870 domain-containing protein [Planctomycetaceae bacterium]|jgi:uncharacterized Tic20 family protein|nr:DUF4870 domain-containing protein [Planctomycetaceae bacterium]